MITFGGEIEQNCSNKPMSLIYQMPVLEPRERESLGDGDLAGNIAGEV
jgi:hypothetical protein